MSGRKRGFDEPQSKRAEPREIAASSAAPEPSGRAPDPVFRDDTGLVSGWQSVSTAGGAVFSLARLRPETRVATSVLRGG